MRSQQLSPTQEKFEERMQYLRQAAEASSDPEYAEIMQIANNNASGLKSIEDNIDGFHKALQKTASASKASADDTAMCALGGFHNRCACQESAAKHSACRPLLQQGAVVDKDAGDLLTCT